jgi:general secretion pathway protein A
MYLDYFGLSRLPFSIAPDPDLLYLSPAHHEALAHLNYALTGHGGLICLTGEVGMGKTTLCRAFIDQAPQHVNIAYIFNPVLSATELLQAICQELVIPCRDSNNQLFQSNNQLFDALYHELIQRYAQGKKVICIIDEAQSMPAPLLEQIRLLTNLETNKDKLLTLILVGQPELQETLSQHGIRQLDQRITARFHLKNMQLAQLKPYLQHRLHQAGCGEELFDNNAIEHIWKSAKGIPRLINSIADRALLGAYATNKKKVNKKIAIQAVFEVLGDGTTEAERITSSRKTILIVFILILLPTLLVAGLSFTQISAIQWVDKIASSLNLISKNHYALLAEANGLNSGAIDMSSCARIKANSEQQCLSLDWSLSDLKRLERPIASFDGKQWRVSSPSELNARPLSSLILWKPIAGFEDVLNQPIKPGTYHSLVVWVREQIKNIEIVSQAGSDALASDQSNWQVISPTGQESLGFNDFYDPLLAEKIADFQTSKGLRADKIIGLKTLLALQNLAVEAN